MKTTKTKNDRERDDVTTIPCVTCRGSGRVAGQPCPRCSDEAHDDTSDAQSSPLEPGKQVDFDASSPLEDTHDGSEEERIPYSGVTDPPPVLVLSDRARERFVRACDMLSASLVRCLDALACAAFESAGLNVEAMQAAVVRGETHEAWSRARIASRNEDTEYAIEIDGKIVTPWHGFFLSFDDARGMPRGDFRPVDAEPSDTLPAPAVDAGEGHEGEHEHHSSCATCGVSITYDDGFWSHDVMVDHRHEPTPTKN